MNKQALLRKLMELDFVAVELQLYLNTHPDCREALEKFNFVVAQAQMLRQEYERRYGPLTSFRSPSMYPWQWINNPWPWDYSFNFRTAENQL